MPDGFIFGESCTAPDFCIAVGRHINSLGIWATLAEVRNGASWKIQATPNPAGANGSALSGVSCTAVSACTAAGFHTKFSGIGATLGEAES